MNDKIKGVFAGTLGLKPEEIDALIEVSEDNEMDVSKLNQALINRTKQLKEEQFNRGFKESNKKYESYVSEKGFQNDGTLKGVELIAAFYDNKKVDDTQLERLKKEKDELLEKINSKSDLDPKITKEYLELEGNYRKVLDSLPAKIEEAKKEVQSQYQLKNRVSLVKNMISDEVISSDEFELPEDTAKRRIHLDRLLLSDFENYDYVIPDGVKSIENVVVMKRTENGSEPITDEFGHKISLKKLVDDLANSTLQKKTSTSKTGTKAATSSNFSAGSITTLAEAEKIARDVSIDPEVRMEMIKKFNSKE